MTYDGPIISLEHDGEHNGDRDILTIDNGSYIYSWTPIHQNADAVNYYYDKLGRKFVTRHNKVKYDIFETYRALFIRKLLVDPFPITCMNFDDINRFMDGLELRTKYGSNLLSHLDYFPVSAKTLEVMCALAQRMSRMILLPSNGDISAIFLLDMLDNLGLLNSGWTPEKFEDDDFVNSIYYNIHDIFGEKTSTRSLWDQAFNYISWYLGPTKILTEQLNGPDRDKYLDILYRVGVKGYSKYAELGGSIVEGENLSGYKSIVNLVK